MSPRRELTLALAGCVLAGALALSSSGQRWLQVTVPRPLPLPPVVATFTGGQAAPLVPACGLLLLAAAVAVLAVRGAGRVAVGLLVVAAGAGLGWSGLRVLTGDLTAAAAAGTAGAAGEEAAASGQVSAGWPAIVVAAGTLAVLAGLLVAATLTEVRRRRAERLPGVPAPSER